MDELGFHCTIFKKFRIYVFFEQTVEKIQVSLKSNKNKEYFI